jgi:hypothetical protein
MPYAPSVIEVPESLGTTLKPPGPSTQQPRISVICHFPFMLSPPLRSLMKCHAQPRRLQISGNTQMRRTMARVTRPKGHAIGMTLCCTTKTTSPFSLHLPGGNAGEAATTYKSERARGRAYGSAGEQGGCVEQGDPRKGKRARSNGIRMNDRRGRRRSDKGMEEVLQQE